MTKVKWSDAVKAYNKGRVKKGTKEYDECKKLFEKMKQEAKEEKKEVSNAHVKEEKKEEIKKVIEEIHEELSQENKISHRKSAIELLKILKEKKDKK